jgi:hypothetical protein
VGTDAIDKGLKLRISGVSVAVNGVNKVGVEDTETPARSKLEPLTLTLGNSDKTPNKLRQQTICMNTDSVKKCLLDSYNPCLPLG